MVPDAPLQIRHRGSVVACPDLVSGHCCMVEGMTKKYQQLSYNVSPHTHHHSPYPHPLSGCDGRGIHYRGGMRIIGQKYGWEGG